MDVDEERERLEDLEQILEELIRDNMTTPIIVEGIKDKTALRKLGCEGVILLINTGKSIVNLATEIATQHKKVIILTDWDREGGHLARLLTSAFDNNAISYDMDYRKRLALVAKKDVKDVEALPKFCENLHCRVETSDPRRHKFDIIEERKERADAEEALEED